MFLRHLHLALGLLAFLALESDSGDHDSDDSDDNESEDDDDDDAAQRGSKRSKSGDDEDDDESFKAPKSAEELDRMIRRRIKRAQKKAADDAVQKLKDELEAEDAVKKGDLQKLLDLEKARAERLEKELAESKQGSIRDRVAKAHKLPPELAEVLKGDTEEELTAHAKKLAKVAKLSADEDDDTEDDDTTSDVDNDTGAPSVRKKGSKKIGPQFRIASSVKTVKMPEGM